MNVEGSATSWGRVAPRVGAVLVLAIVALAAATGLPTRAEAAPGSLSGADRDLLVKVRLAGLWAAPAGRLAQDHTTNERIKLVGHHLTTDHLALDEQVRAVAAKLGVELPTRAGTEQLGWIAELTAARGADFDRVFANRLRVAHGTVFSVVAEVRAATRNDAIRQFATTANNVVMKHMTLLESTGMVEFDALPAAAAPPPAALVPASANLSARSASVNPNIVWLVLGLALVTGLVTAIRLGKPR